MTSTFPSAPDNIRSDVVNGTAEQNTHPDLHNQLASAVNAVETQLLPGGTMNLPGHTQAANPHPQYVQDIGGLVVGGTLTAKITDTGGEVFNVMAYGAKGDGVTDDTAAIQATLNAAMSVIRGGLRGATVYVPTGMYILTGTLDWTGFSNVRMLGAGQMDGFIGGSVLRWNGPADGIVNKLYQARGNLIEAITMQAGSSTPGVYVDMDQPLGSIKNCTHNSMRRCYMATFSIAGVRIGLAGTANSELNYFDDVYISTGPCGYLILEGQSKFNYITAGSTGQCTDAGIKCVSGSFTSISTNFSNNEVDIYLGQPVDDIVIINPQSETAKRFLDGAGPSGVGWVVTVLGGRLSTDSVHADGNYICYRHAGPLNLIGVAMGVGGGQPAPRIMVGAGLPSRVNASGCGFPNNTIWNKVGGNPVYVNQIGCNYTDATGHGVPLPDLFDGTGWGMFGTSGVAQQNGTGNTATVAAGSTTNVFTNTTFSGGTGSTGYTVGDIVKALKAYGLLAA